MENLKRDNYNITDLKFAVEKLKVLYSNAENLKESIAMYPDDIKLRKKLYLAREQISKIQKITHALSDEMYINFSDLSSAFRKYFLENYDLKICFPILENRRDTADEFKFYQTTFLNVKDDADSKVILQQQKTKSPFDISNLNYFKINSYHLLIPETIKDKSRRYELIDFKKTYPQFDHILYTLIEKNILNSYDKTNIVDKYFGRQFQDMEETQFNSDEIHSNNDFLK